VKIGFLGLGKMGAAMAVRLLAAGNEVAVWNRDVAKADALIGHGARVAATPAEAAQGVDAVVSMLFDDAAYEEVVLGADGAITELKPGAVHIACGTISVALSTRLAEEHAKRGQTYVAAPVFGRPNVAAEGKLWIVAAGAEDALALARPVLEQLSRGISIAGSRPAQAHAVKLAGNFMISMMIQAMSEAIVFSRANGIDAAGMLEMVNSALFQSPFYAAYGKVILDPPDPPGATVALGVKDLNLFLDAADEAGVKLAIAEAMGDRFSEAILGGLSNADWAAGMLKAAEKYAQN
jgi:3-hydroxyisobutyrate dehydrogenase-like beta-hydroxyacid dehydrogenase